MVDDPFADGIYSWKYILAQVDSGSSMSCFESFPDFYVRLPLVAYYENNTLNAVQGNVCGSVSLWHLLL